MKPVRRCWIFWHPWKSRVPFGHCQRCNRPPLACFLFGHVLLSRGGRLDPSWYCARCGVLDPIVDIFQPDYEARKAARERKERLHSLAEEIVGRTTTGVWEGWEGTREQEWRQLTGDMDKAAVDRLVLDACWDDKTRAEYLAIHKPTNS